MDIKKLDLKSLKVLAYDEGVKFEQARQNIQIINAEIVARIQQDGQADKKKPESKKEDKK